MSDINSLHDRLDTTYEVGMDNIRAEIASASCRANRVEELRSFFEEHEVRVYNMRRTFLASLSTKAAWRGSIEGIRYRLKQGLCRLSNQLSKSERDNDWGVSPTRTRHEVVPQTDTIYVESIL